MKSILQRFRIFSIQILILWEIEVAYRNIHFCGYCFGYSPDFNSFPVLNQNNRPIGFVTVFFSFTGENSHAMLKNNIQRALLFHLLFIMGKLKWRNKIRTITCHPILDDLSSKNHIRASCRYYPYFNSNVLRHSVTEICAVAWTDKSCVI